jgi:U3 small nucleolar RNA-associated protein 12
LIHLHLDFLSSTFSIYKVIVGTKTGELEIYDIASATLLEKIEAHSGAIWSMDVKPDKSGIVTGSADKEVKFWDFELVASEEQANTKRLSLSHTRTLKMSDDVMCVRFSSDRKFIAVSLLDSTVKVFYEDNLRFFLSLYGHKVNQLYIIFTNHRPSNNFFSLVTCDVF